MNVSSASSFFFFFKDRLLLYISGYPASCQVAQDGLELSSILPPRTHQVLLLQVCTNIPDSAVWQSPDATAEVDDKFQCISSLCQILILLYSAGKENGGWYYLRKSKLSLLEEKAFITIFAATMCPVTHRCRDGFLVIYRFHLIRNGSTAVVQAFNFNTPDAEAGRSLSLNLAWSMEKVPGQQGLHRETLVSKNKTETVLPQRVRAVTETGSPLQACTLSHTSMHAHSPHRDEKNAQW